MMITRHESHGSFAKQFLREGSMGGIAHVSHLHSHHAYSSGENLSPRSVLEQRALSGLAIAIDLEEKMKLLHTQENVMFGRCFSKQSIMHMGTQEARAKEGRSLSRERLNHMMCMHHDEIEASSVGLKVVIGIQQMGDGEGKAQEKPMMGRSLSRESMRQVMHVKEREGVGIRVGPSSGREKNKDYVCISEKKVGCSGDPPLKSPLSSSACRSSCKRGQSTWWLHELGHAQQSAPACASMEDSMFYYGPANPLPPPPAHHHCSVEDGCQAGSPVEDFLKRCFFCKRRLGAGKDIYMYRGDQAFCSIECRCEQIARDECMGTSTL